MFYAGIDAHVKSSTIWIVDRKGRKVSNSTVVTSAEGFAARRALRAAFVRVLQLQQSFHSESTLEKRGAAERGS